MEKDADPSRAPHPSLGVLPMGGLCPPPFVMEALLPAPVSLSLQHSGDGGGGSDDVSVTCILQEHLLPSSGRGTQHSPLQYGMCWVSNRSPHISLSYLLACLYLQMTEDPCWAGSQPCFTPSRPSHPFHLPGCIQCLRPGLHTAAFLPCGVPWAVHGAAAVLSWQQGEVQHSFLAA